MLRCVCMLALMCVLAAHWSRGQLAEFGSLDHIGSHLSHRELVELPGSSVLSHKHPAHRAGAHYSIFISFMLYSVSRLKAAAYHCCCGLTKLGKERRMSEKFDKLFFFSVGYIYMFCSAVLQPLFQH